MQEDIPEFKPVMAALDHAFLAHDSEIVSFLKEAENELDLFLKKELAPEKLARPAGLLPTRIFSIFGRILEKSSSALAIFHMANIFHTLLHQKLFNLGKRPNNELVSIANMYLQLHEMLEGSEIQQKLVSSIKETIDHLNRRDLSKEQHRQLEQVQATLAEKKKEVLLNADERLSKIEHFKIDASDNEKAQAVLDIMDLLGETESLEEQYEIFVQKGQKIFKILLANTDGQSFKLFSQILTLLKLYFFESEYLIREDSFNSQKSTLPYAYSLFEEQKKVLRFYFPQCFQILHHVLHHILTVADTIPRIQSEIIPLLKTLYFDFPDYRKKVAQLVLQLFENVAFICENGFNQLLTLALKFKAALEWEHIVVEELQTGLLRSEKAKIFRRAVKQIKDHQLFYKALDIQTRKDFNLRIAFPLAVTVPAGGSYSRLVEIKKPYSLIYCGFATLRDDIAFGIEQVTLDTQIMGKNKLQGLKEIQPVTRLMEQSTPQRITMITPEPGLYRLTWSNDYSWFASKRVRFRISVLQHRQASSKVVDAREKIPEDAVAVRRVKIFQNLKQIMEQQFYSSSPLSSLYQHKKVVLLYQNEDNKFTLQIGELSHQLDHQTSSFVFLITGSHEIPKILKIHLEPLQDALIVLAGIYKFSKNEQSTLESISVEATGGSCNLEEVRSFMEEELKSFDFLVTQKIDLLNCSHFTRQFIRFSDRESSWLCLNTYEKEDQKMVQTSFLRTSKEKLNSIRNGVNLLPFGSDEGKLMTLEEVGFNLEAIASIIHNITLIEPSHQLVISMTEETPVDMSVSLQQGINTLFKMNIETPAFLPHVSIIGRRTLSGPNDPKVVIHSLSGLLLLFKE